MGKSSKLGPGPTGPRTPPGKERSSRNSIKHGLYCGRVLLGEEQEAARLHRVLRKQLHLDGVEDEYFGSNMVLDELQKTRLDKYTCEEQRKADIQAARDEVSRLELRWCLKRDSLSAHTRPHPEICVIFLEKIKADIEERGLNPEEDLPILYRVFSRGDGKVSCLGTSIILPYEVLKHTKAEGQSANSSAERQTRVLKGIEDAIKFEQSLANWEALIEMQEPSDVNALLPDAVADRILRSGTAIQGHFIRELDGLERYRRLRKCSSE
jgi:hypothetical protein